MRHVVLLVKYKISCLLYVEEQLRLTSNTLDVLENQCSLLDANYEYCLCENQILRAQFLEKFS